MLVNYDLYYQLYEAVKEHTPCVLASVINIENSTSANIGDKAIIDLDGDLTGWIGGGCCQGIVKKLASDVLNKNKPITIRVCPKDKFVKGMDCYPSHCASEGIVDIFLEPIANEKSILLYGQTPVAHSIARYSAELGLNLQWYKSSVEFSDKNNERAHVAIVATQGQDDTNALKDALSHEVNHVLMVASQKKSTAIINNLHQEGVSQQITQKIMAPAGLDIGATSPAEIALSIMAKVVELNKLEPEPYIDKVPTLTVPSPEPSSCCSAKSVKSSV